MLLLLVTMGEPSIAGCYLRVWRRGRYRLATTPAGRSRTDNISGDMKIMSISGDTGVVISQWY